MLNVFLSVLILCISLSLTTYANEKISIVTHSNKMTLQKDIPSSLVILQYHHVSESTPYATSISPKLFNEHLSLIKKSGIPVVGIKEGLNNIKQNPINQQYIAITFDDASYTIWETAQYILSEYAFPYTIFVNTQSIQTNNKYSLSWQQLNELTLRGAIIGNHSHRHDHLIDEDYDWLSDINHAAEIIENNIDRNHSQKLFAYPYGEYSADMADKLDQLGWISLGQHSGPVGNRSHLGALPRFPVSGPYSDIELVKQKLHTIPFSYDDNTLGIRSDKLSFDLYDPIVNEVNSSKMINVVMNINPSLINISSLNCYHNEVGLIDKSNIKTHSLSIEINTYQPTLSRRGRINCTAPLEKLNPDSTTRFYWQSQLLINPQCTEIKC